MSILAQAGPVRVTKNATHLTDSGGISDSALAASLDDDTVLANGTYGVIEAETIGIASAGSSPRTITRGENNHNGDATSATQHDESVFVRKQGGGHELLSYVFDGSTDFAGFKVRSERAFWWALEVGGSIVDEGFCSSNVPFYIDVRPLETVAAGTWKILVWWQAPSSESRTGQVFWGSIFN